jgi:alpha-beta hydrolase superfamily lysophospholipase
VQPEYVYLLRVVEAAQHTSPKAKIPTVLLPAAEPEDEAVVAAPPALTTHPE